MSNATTRISFKTPFILLCLFLAVAGPPLLRGLSLIVASGADPGCGARACHCSGFSRCGAQALGRVGFRSCGSRALEQGLRSCGTGLCCSLACGIFPDQGSSPCLHIDKWMFSH